LTEHRRSLTLASVRLHPVVLAAAVSALVLLLPTLFPFLANGAPMAEGPGESLTLHLFATREGLVGRKTANGHTVVEHDRFVALPSRKVLNPDGKQDYQVRVSYKGRSATAPVWDVGPWNTRDNYWDEKRELFGELPRFQPEAFAAWQSDFNGGRDQYNRWVSFPAGIDLADGTFADDLGMRVSDWVDVTFLWVSAASPPTVDLPVVTGLKPEPKARQLAEQLAVPIPVVVAGIPGPDVPDRGGGASAFVAQADLVVLLAIRVQDLPGRQGDEAIVLDDRVTVRGLAPDQALARGEEACRWILSLAFRDRSAAG